MRRCLPQVQSGGQRNPGARHYKLLPRQDEDEAEQHRGHRDASAAEDGEHHDDVVVGLTLSSESCWPVIEFGVRDGELHQRQRVPGHRDHVRHAGLAVDVFAAPECPRWRFQCGEDFDHS